MDFKQFYKEIIFDIDNSMNTLYSAKQGDTKSRGFYVTLTQNNIVVPVTTQSMTFYAEKPDGTRVFQNAIKDGDKFRIDISNQVFATKGIVKCELALRGSNGEKISSKTFKMMIEEQLVDDSIMSADDIGIVDNALDLLADYEGAITTVEDNLAAHMAEKVQLKAVHGLQVQTGAVGVTTSSTSNIINQSFSFPVAFSGTPKVVLNNPNGLALGNKRVLITALSVSTTGFNVVANTIDDSNFTAEHTRNINYIAIL